MTPLCHIEWGRRGGRLAAERGDIVVVVDTLSFSTATAMAVDRGAQIYPCTNRQETRNLAIRHDAHFAVGRSEVPRKGKYSLSPITFKDVSPNTRIVLYSLNGASCCESAHRSSHILLGSLINARAVAETVQQLSLDTGKGITVLACGEQVADPTHDDDIRHAIEDLLGAGAVVAHLSCAKSAESLVFEGAFKHHKRNLESLLWDSESGLELRERGFGDDVKFAARLNLISSTPVLRNKFFDKA